MKLAWYTAVRTNQQAKFVPLSGPHDTKETADALVAKPGSRDREIAEAIDPWAHFDDYFTVAFRSSSRVRPVIKDPRAIRILREKGIEVPA